MTTIVAEITDEDRYEEFLQKLRASKDNLCEFYGIYGEKYDDFIKNHFPWNLKELFANEFVSLQPNTNARILDIGCGTGLFAQELLKRGYSNIDGLDGTRTLDELCLKKGVMYKRFYEFRIQENIDLPMRPAKYDVVLGADAVYKDHISMRAFEKIIKVIKPGGLLGWSHVIWCKGPVFNPLPDDYESLENLIQRNLIKPIAGYFPKIVKSIPNKFEQRVWFVQIV